MAWVDVLAQVPVQAVAWLAAGGALLLLWLVFGQGPRRRRRYGRARRQLRLGQWQQALAEITPPTAAGHSASWQQRFRKIEADCHALAGEQALAQKEYEASVDHHVRAAQLFELDSEAVRTRLSETMLSELRSRFADGADVQVLGNRLLKLFPTCAEALFWQALDDVRRGQTAAAIDKLLAANDLTEPMLDPPLYLGALLLRQGTAADAQCHLAAAHRLAAGCPLVSWQRGVALIAAQTEEMQAVGLLQFAVGPDGLRRWLRQPAQLWTEGYADTGHAYVPRLAAAHPFHCPVFGTDVASMILQARLALGQAHEALKQYGEAAEVYTDLLRDYPPTVPVLRGLGLALARLGRYDEAFTHLRTAHAGEQVRDPLVAGYLALCAARGKPLRPEDRADNLRWALGLLRQFEVRDDEEWVAVYAAVATEARTAGLTLSATDVQRLCAALVSVAAITPDAAFAYADLASIVPEALRAEHARLYGRAAVMHRLVTAADLSLFARLFEDETEATADYEARGWDLNDIRAYYLERHAAARLGSFPDGLHGSEDFLLQRSEQQERSDQPEAALRSARLLRALAPHSARALDRLAFLHHRRGELAQSAIFLADWEALEAANPMPTVRRAIIERALGRADESAAAITRALALTTGQARAQVAALGARLALSVPPPRLVGAGAPEASAAVFEPSWQYSDLERAEQLLQQCLGAGSPDAQALTRLAAVRSLRGEQQKLADLAPAMYLPDVADPAFHYMAAACHLAAGAAEAALNATDQAAADSAWSAEAAYLRARARLALQDDASAVREMNEILAHAPGGPLGDYARALLGCTLFGTGQYQRAAHCWDALAPERRIAWKLEQPLTQTMYLAGALALGDRQFAEALPWLQTAASRGAPCRELLNHARWCAAEQAAPQRTVELLERMVDEGAAGPQVLYRLALAHKGLGRLAEAREALDALPPGDAAVHLQLGLLALRENQLEQAEAEFSHAWTAAPNSFESGYNLLLTRLSLGRCEPAAALAQNVALQAPDLPRQRLLEQLRGLLHLCQPANGAVHVDPALASMTAAEEQRLVDLLGRIGHLECMDSLFRGLQSARPESTLVRDAAFETLLLRARELVNHGRWPEARRRLAARAADPVSPPLLAAGLNLLGVCECLMQDFAGGRESFEAALRLVGNDARLWQNLALVCEWQQRDEEAGTHWQRFVTLLNDRLAMPPEQSDYSARLACATLSRLAALHAAREDWPAARSCLERAHQVWPAATEVLERLFHLHRQTADFEEASRILDVLHQQSPEQARYEAYRLDLIELRTPDDVEQVLASVQRLKHEHTDDPELEASLALVLGHAVTGLVLLHEELAGQLARARARLRRLPSFDVDWDEVEDFARRLHRRLLKLKCVVDRGVLLTDGDEQQQLRNVSQKLTREAAQCRRLVH